MSRFFAVTAVLAVAFFAASTTPAPAATLVGNECAANGAAADTTLLQLAVEPGGAPMTVPTAGVVTSWRVNSAIPGAVLERLKVFRSAGGPEQFQVIAESGGQSVMPGQNSFETRIPVLAGDRFGAYENIPSGTLYCQTMNAADKIGYFSDNVAVGSTQTFLKQEGLRVAVAAVVEPDADNDGYGDETQDKCPQSAVFQAACPTLLLDAVAQAAGKGSVTILVATSSDAPTSVTATVKLPGGSKKARASAQANLTAAAQTVTAGRIAAFKLKFPGSLKSALAATPKGKSLKLKVTATGNNVAGVSTTKDLVVKLKGRG